jgi:hypothetical protein
MLDIFVYFFSSLFLFFFYFESKSTGKILSFQSQRKIPKDCVCVCASSSSSHLENDTPGLFGRGKNPREETIERGGEQLNATAVENVGYSLCWPFVESLCARDRNNKAKPRQQ